MGCFDIYCFICGNPCHGLNKNIDKELLTKYKNTFKWMNNCTLLLADDTVQHNLIEYAGTTEFKKKSFKGEHMYMFEEDYNKNYGIFIHDDCYKFVNQTYNINLKFSYLPKFNNVENNIYNFKYGELDKYRYNKNKFSQFFNFEQLILDDKLYLSSSPLLNDKNIKQIKKNLSTLKFKNNSKRVGPLVSATFFANKDIKIGSDNKFWEKKKNKWILINEKPITLFINLKKNTSLKQKEYLESLRYIGQYDIKPIFIKSKKKNILELLTHESYKQNIILTI